ncbi:unnamed protein product [Camellia sinensis]
MELKILYYLSSILRRQTPICLLIIQSTKGKASSEREREREREMVVRKVGKYEVGRTIGEGNLAKVKFAQCTESGESVAVKVLDRSTILKHKMVDQ